MGSGVAQPVAAHATGPGDTFLQVYLNGNLVPSVLSNLPDEVDVSFKTYTICEPPDDKSPVESVAVSGWTVNTLIVAAGATPQTTSSVSIERNPGPGAVLLGPLDYPPPPAKPDFPEGPALLVTRGFPDVKGASFDFFRPYRGTSTNPVEGCGSDTPNLNGLDYVQPAEGPLVIHIAAGTPLQVRASASNLHPTAGSKVSFSATVASPPSGIALTYTWTFGDRTTASGARVSHSFATAGNYSAEVAVSGTDDSNGTAQLELNVGKAPGPPGHAASPTTSTTQPATVGGPTGAPPQGQLPTSTTSSDADSAPSAQAPPTIASSVSRPPVTEAGSASASASASTVPQNVTPPARPVARTTAPFGVTVTGFLVGGGSEIPSDSPPAGKEKALGPQGTKETSGSWPWRTVLFALVPLALIGAGIGSERRPRLRRRQGSP